MEAENESCELSGEGKHVGPPRWFVGLTQRPRNSELVVRPLCRAGG
jgi:hypothetical protein